MLNTKEAVQNLRKAIREESLIQGEWSSEDHGRHLGCLLHQLGNGLDIRNHKDCPASVMPEWMAEFVPGAFDGVSADAVYTVAEDFAATLESTTNWTPERWEKLRVDFLCGLIDMAVEAAEPVSKDLQVWSAVAEACKLVQDALRGNGDIKAAWAAARAAAWAAAWAAERAAARREQFAMLRRFASA